MCLHNIFHLSVVDRPQSFHKSRPFRLFGNTCTLLIKHKYRLSMSQRRQYSAFVHVMDRYSSFFYYHHDYYYHDFVLFLTFLHSHTLYEELSKKKFFYFSIFFPIIAILSFWLSFFENPAIMPSSFSSLILLSSNRPNICQHSFVSLWTLVCPMSAHLVKTKTKRVASVRQIPVWVIGGGGFPRSVVYGPPGHLRNFSNRQQKQKHKFIRFLQR